MRTLILLLLAGTIQAQVITDAVQINSVEGLKFVELVRATGSGGDKYKITLDYGELKSLKTFNGVKLKKFVHALQFMDDKGWEFIDSYSEVNSIPMGGTIYWYHYIFKKRE